MKNKIVLGLTTYYIEGRSHFKATETAVNKYGCPTRHNLVLTVNIYQFVSQHLTRKLFVN